jgi:transposase-like protein
MKRSRFGEEQIIGILREVQGGGNTRAVCAAHNISEGTYYAWKRKYGGMDVSEARRLRALEDAPSAARYPAGNSLKGDVNQRRNGYMKSFQ